MVLRPPRTRRRPALIRQMNLPTLGLTAMVAGMNAAGVTVSARELAIVVALAVWAAASAAARYWDVTSNGLEGALTTPPLESVAVKA